MLIVEALDFIPMVVSREEDGAGARCQELEMRGRQRHLALFGNCAVGLLSEAPSF